MAKQNIPKPWNSDDEFELLLQQSLSAIQPPADFSKRVMAAVHQEAAAQKTSSKPAEVIPFAGVKQAKKRRFGFLPSVGTIAAGLLLFWAAFGLPGASSDAPGALPQIQPASSLQVAAGPMSPEKLQRPERTESSAPASDSTQVPEQNTPSGPIPEQSGGAADSNSLGAAEQLNSSTEPGNSVNEPGNATEPDNSVSEPGDVTKPDNSVNEPGNVTEPDNSVNEPGNATEPGGTSEPGSLNESGEGELILPRAAFGTDAEGTLSVRLLAEVPDSQIYTPAINRRGSIATFYTADEENVYSWRVNLSTADSPEIALVTSRSSIDDIGSLLAKTTEPCDAITLVASPDNTIMAQNSADGLWISLAEGEVYSLSEDAGGSLLAWSPDSSKLLFTNSQGQLLVGYPLEKRIYQVTDMSVEDVCWSTDNQTIIFLVTNNGQSALYIAELI